MALCIRTPQWPTEPKRYVTKLIASALFEVRFDIPVRVVLCKVNARA